MHNFYFVLYLYVCNYNNRTDTQHPKHNASIKAPSLLQKIHRTREINFSTRFKEQANSVATNSNNSNYTQSTVGILHVTKKGKKLITIEIFNICNPIKKPTPNLQPHFTKNPIFDRIITEIYKNTNVGKHSLNWKHNTPRHQKASFKYSK